MRSRHPRLVTTNTSISITITLVISALSGCGYQLNPYTPPSLRLVSQRQLKVLNHTPYPSVTQSAETAWLRWSDDKHSYEQCPAPHLAVSLAERGVTWSGAWRGATLIDERQGVEARALEVTLRCVDEARDVQSVITHTHAPDLSQRSWSEREVILFSLDGRHATQHRLARALDLIISRLAARLRRAQAINASRDDQDRPHKKSTR